MLDDRTLDTLLRQARSHNVWLDKPVTDDQLRQVYDLMKWGPTSANCQPARILFLRTPEAKTRLLPALSPGNVEKTKAAPVTAIIGYDTRFFEHYPGLMPHNPAVRSWFEPPEKAEYTHITAFRNGTLQGGYFLLVARALGLDCGAMSGFDNAKVDAEFFPDGRVRSNFLCNLGHGDASQLFPRSPRLTFEQACRLM